MLLQIGVEPLMTGSEGSAQAVIVFVAITVPLVLPVRADNVTLPVDADHTRVTVVGLPEEVTVIRLVLELVQ